jgi:predicted RNA-binding Zn-ribbon protein involved in translation (DUF1610 family)
MAGPLNAKVVMAKCSKNKKSFGIRIEERGRDWVRTWAFPIDEQKAKREGYSASSTSTLSGVDDGYPGCPHCGSVGIVRCGCEKISCDGGVQDFGDHGEFTCPWCNETMELQKTDSIDVSGGGY